MGLARFIWHLVSAFLRYGDLRVVTASNEEVCRVCSMEVRSWTDMGLDEKAVIINLE